MWIRRQIGPFLFILMLGTLGMLSYFSRYPDSPWLEQAQEWPVVGEAATLFRQAYLGNPEAGAPSDGESSEMTESETQIAVQLEAKSQPIHSEAVKSRARTKSTSNTGTPQSIVAQDMFQKPSGVPINVGHGHGEGHGHIDSVSVYRNPRRQNRSQLPAKPSYGPVLETRWLMPGQPLYKADGLGGKNFGVVEEIVHLPSLSRLPVLNIDGERLEVVYRGARYWLDGDW